jgi:hypothetical protein
MPEQGGTGIRCAPEQGGTGVVRHPERGGTGLRRALLALALVAGLPFAPAQAGEPAWVMSGELSGPAQLSIDADRRMQMSFMLPGGERQGAAIHVAAGQLKGDFARLAVHRVDLATNEVALHAVGTLELIVGACGAEAELRLKSESEGSGGKSESEGSGGKSESEGSGGKRYISYAFTLGRQSAQCLVKSESEGSG